MQLAFGEVELFIPKLKTITVSNPSKTDVLELTEIKSLSPRFLMFLQPQGYTEPEGEGEDAVDVDPHLAVPRPPPGRDRDLRPRHAEGRHQAPLPAAMRAIKSAVAGAITIASAVFASDTWRI